MIGAWRKIIRTLVLPEGGRGTPWSIVVAKSGKTYPLSGAQPYAALKQLVDLALQEK